MGNLGCFLFGFFFLGYKLMEKYLRLIIFAFVTVLACAMAIVFVSMDFIIGAEAIAWFYSFISFGLGFSWVVEQVT